MSSNSNNWEDLLGKAIVEREKGSVEASVRMFYKILESVKSSDSRMLVLNHLGLAYFHLGKYKEAKDKWSTVLAIISGVKNPTNMAAHEKAAAYRNLSRKELYITKEGLRQALRYAEVARSIAASIKSTDLVWFTHGLIGAHLALKENHNKIEAEKLLKSEARELSSALTRVSLMQSAVWFEGLVMDYAIIHNKVSKPMLKMGKVISSKISLKRREEQIDKLLKELE